MSASSLIDWVAIGSWSAAAAFQMGTALRDGWKSFRSRRNRGIVRRFHNGESVNGWRRIIPRLADGVRYASNSSVYIVTPATGDQDPEGGQGGDGYSVDFVITSRLLDGQEAFHLRRCSRLRQTSTLLLEMIYSRDQWTEQISCYLDTSTISTVFRQKETTTFKVLLVNVKSRAVGQFLVEAPDEVYYANHVYLSILPKLQVHIIYSTLIEDEDGTRYLHFIDSSYDHPPVDTPSSSIIRPSSWESISVPLGNRHAKCYKYIWPWLAEILGNPDDGDAGNLCIWIDSMMQWHIDTRATWGSSFRNTACGASVLNAMRAMDACYSSEVFRYPRQLLYVLLLAKREFLTGEDRPGTLQRRLAPFSLKRSAAEVACKANPDAKMFVIKEATGVDVSDGIMEDGDGDGDCQVIYL